MPLNPLHVFLQRAGLACAAAVSLTAQAAAPPVQLLMAASEIVFTTRQMGVPVDGHFGKFSAQVMLDTKNPQAGSIALNIDTGSARFGAAEVDAEVVKPVWLNVGQFPQARFQSQSIRAAGAGRFEVLGQLSIKGAVQALRVPVQITQAGAHSTASGSFTIKRLDYKLGEAEWSDTALVANDVVVKFKLVLSGLAPL